MIELIAVLSGFNNRITQIFNNWLKHGAWVKDKVDETARKQLTLLFSIVFGIGTMAALVFWGDVSLAGYDLGAIGRNEWVAVILVGGLTSAGAGGFQHVLDFLIELANARRES